MGKYSEVHKHMRDFDRAVKDVENAPDEYARQEAMDRAGASLVEMNLANERTKQWIFAVACEDGTGE